MLTAPYAWLESVGGGVKSLQFCEPGEVALSDGEDFVLEECKSFLCEKLDGLFSLFEDVFLHFVLCLLDVVIPDLYSFCRPTMKWSLKHPMACSAAFCPWRYGGTS